MSAATRTLALAGFVFASVVSLSDKPSASSLAATTNTNHDAQGKGKGTIAIHDAQSNGQGSRNTVADPPDGTSHEPTAHVQLHLEHAGCSPHDVELNLGSRSSPEACAAAVLGHVGCDRSFMYAPSHPEWGCRCCAQGSGEESSNRQDSFVGSPEWNVYLAGTGAEAVESHQHETAGTPVVWVAPSACGCNPCPCVVVAPSACGCNPCPCVVVAEPPAASANSELIAWAATQSVNAAVWQAEIDSLATTVSRTSAEATRSSAEARAAEEASRRAQADATAAVIAAEAFVAPSGASGSARRRSTSARRRTAAVDVASLEDFGRQVGLEVGTAALAYPGDGYAPTIEAGDGVAQSVDDFVAAAAAR